MRISIGNELNDDVVNREMTSEEVTAWKVAQQEGSAKTAQIEASRTALASARAKLAALGLSEAEVAAVLGN